MKQSGLIAAMALLLGQHAFGQTTGCDVAIINGGFEDPPLVENDYMYFVPGWIVLGDGGVFNPGAQTYPGGIVAEGTNCAFVSCCAGERVPGILHQTLPAFLSANTSYELSLSIGQRLETPWANIRVQLIAGVTPVIDSVITSGPTAGTFVRRTLSFACPAAHPALGGRLEVRVVHEGGGAHQANLDDFRLVATPLCASFCSQPSAVRVCRGGTAEFSAVSAGVGPFTYRWFRNGAAMNDGVTAWGSIVTGAGTGRLSIGNAKNGDSGGYVLTVTNGCGSVSTQSAELVVCGADFNCDGLVDQFDYLDFAFAFGANSPSADWNEDGLLDMFDYLDFLNVLMRGC